MPLSEMSVQCITARLVWVDWFFEEEHIRNCGHRRDQWEIEAGFKHHREAVKLIYEAQGGCVLRSIGYRANTSMFLRVLQCRCGAEITENSYLI